MTVHKEKNPNDPVSWPTRQQVFDLIYTKENKHKLGLFVVAQESYEHEDLRHFHILLRLKDDSKMTSGSVLKWFEPIK